MNRNKKKLIWLILIQAAVTAIHFLNTKINPSFEPFAIFENWSWYLGMSTGLYLFYFAFTLCCPHCGKRQVFRDWPWATSLNWPTDKCYYCKLDIP